MRRTSLGILLPLAATLALVTAAGPASAMYVITPLTLTPGSAEGNVGDEILFEIAPNEDHEGPSLAGRTVTVRISYDPNERAPQGEQDPDEPVSNEDESSQVARDVANVTLDDASRGSFRWTIPAEVDDLNVFVSLVDDAGEGLASAHVRVGDAEPIMFTMAGGQEGDPIAYSPDEDPAATGMAPDAPAEDARQRVPGPGAVGAIGALAVALVVLRRR